MINPTEYTPGQAVVAKMRDGEEHPGTYVSTNYGQKGAWISVRLPEFGLHKFRPVNVRAA